MSTLRALKYRDLVTHFERNGCTRLRTSGSHAVYRLPNNLTFTLVVKHLNEEASKNVFQTAKRALEAAGIPLGDPQMNKQKQLRRTLKTLKNQRDEAREAVANGQASVEGILASKLAPVEVAKKSAEASAAAAQKSTERALMTQQQLRDENAALFELTQKLSQERDELLDQQSKANADLCLAFDAAQPAEGQSIANKILELRDTLKTANDTSERRGERIAALEAEVMNKKAVKLQKRLAQKAEELRLLTLQNDKLKELYAGEVHRSRDALAKLSRLPPEMHPLLRGGA